jgi:transposase
MSVKERERLRVVEGMEEGRLKQAAAGKRLGLSVRQVKRLVRAYRRQGAAGLVSRRRGQPSNRRIAAAERERVVGLVRRRYADFGPTLAREYLSRDHGYRHGRETLRQWMIAAELWRPKAVRAKRVHQLRERRGQVGELVQIDGSPHAWLEGRGPRLTLIIFVDDATSRLVYARFEAAETTRAYLRALRAYVRAHGCPVALYSDKHSIFGKHDPEDPEPTQFERAARALDIAPILALTPQAKGRVERAFQTLQDRLVKALRLAKVRTCEAANAFLPGFVADYNDRFAAVPRESADAHRPLGLDAEGLGWITSEQHTRTLSRALSCQYRGQLYVINTGGAPAYHLRGAKLTVCDDGPQVPVVLLHRGKPLRYSRLTRRDLQPRVADDKTLGAMVDEAVRRRIASQPAASPPPTARAKRPGAATGAALGLQGIGKSTAMVEDFASHIR